MSKWQFSGSLVSLLVIFCHGSFGNQSHQTVAGCDVAGGDDMFPTDLKYRLLVLAAGRKGHHYLPAQEELPHVISDRFEMCSTHALLHLFMMLLVYVHLYR